MTTGVEVDSCAECDLFSTTCECCGYLLCCCTCCKPCCGTAAGSGAKSAGHTASAEAGDAFNNNGTDCCYDSYYPSVGRQAGVTAGIYPTQPLDPILLLNCLQCPQPYDCNYSPAAAAIANSSDLFDLCNFHPMGLCNVGTPFDPPSLPTQHPQTPQKPDLFNSFSATPQGDASFPPLDPLLSITTPATTPTIEPHIKLSCQQQSHSPAPSSAAETGTSEKCRKKRVPLTHEQREYLECIYEKECKPRSIVVQRAAKAIGLDYRYTQYWFQNRRASSKKKGERIVLKDPCCCTK
ncbi:hypothetical protein BJ741DRAFT_592479 [Chytriomyces cf. hyalinus JEL632]|nr:hypothetical protein BJ741DRAFT_592479 [Chytriomyces cf. hyalinus JEL632]